jgi:hypothetical protein
MTNGSNWWLPEAFSTVVRGLCLNSSMIRRMNYEQVLAHMDEARLSCLAEPLTLPRPSEVASQLERAGGSQALFSRAAQVAIASWGTMYRAVQILHQLSKAVLVLLRAHRRGQLANGHAVLRALPVLSMSAFVPGSETLRKDLAAILGGSPEDVPALIKGFGIAALCGNEVVTAIDRRIQADSVWSPWIQVFLKEGRDLVRLCRPATCWEFTESTIRKESANGIRRWLFRR